MCVPGNQSVSIISIIYIFHFIVDDFLYYNIKYWLKFLCMTEYNEWLNFLIYSLFQFYFLWIWKPDLAISTPYLYVICMYNNSYLLCLFVKNKRNENTKGRKFLALFAFPNASYISHTTVGILPLKKWIHFEKDVFIWID